MVWWLDIGETVLRILTGQGEYRHFDQSAVRNERSVSPSVPSVSSVVHCSVFQHTSAL